MEKETESLYAALSKFQGMVRSAAKDKVNPAFKAGGSVSRYASLSSVWDAIRGPLASCELAVVQMPETIDGQLTLRTAVLHRSGVSIEATMVVPGQLATAQQVGSALTYARRYALCSMLGIVADDDDDGESVTAKVDSGPVDPKIVKAISELETLARLEEYYKMITPAERAAHRGFFTARKEQLKEASNA